MADRPGLNPPAVQHIPAPRPAEFHQGQIQLNWTWLAPDVLSLDVRGEIAMATQAEWRDWLAAALAVPRLRRLICDCAGLRFLSIGGFLALVDAHHTARRRSIQIQVVHPPRTLIRLLAVIQQTPTLRTDVCLGSAAALVIPERSAELQQ